MLGCSFYGSAETIKGKLDTLIEETNADELMVAAAIWDHKARVRSFELLAGAMNESTTFGFRQPEPVYSGAHENPAIL